MAISYYITDKVFVGNETLMREHPENNGVVIHWCGRCKSENTVHNRKRFVNWGMVKKGKELLKLMFKRKHYCKTKGLVLIN